MQKIRTIPYYGILALLAYMPFHVFLVQFLSSITGGLNVWKAGIDVVIAAITVFVFCLVLQKGSVPRGFYILSGTTIAYALLHGILWAAHPHIYAPSAAIGTAYNVRVLCFAVIGYGAALLKPGGVGSQRLLDFMLKVSLLVAALGIVQHFLPSNFLTHFGYSTARGARPAFFIDNNPKYIRSMATLRDPNSLGAYLLLPIVLVASRLVRTKISRPKYWVTLAVLLIAVVFTFSRSAWIALMLSLGMVMWWRYQTVSTRLFRRWWPIVLVAVCLIGVGTFAGRHKSLVKSYIIHSTGKPQGKYDSDGFHWYYVKRGVEGIWHDPLGHGPGTAGLASIQNPHGGLLTENYYVQIGYELGVLGLAIFVAANAYAYVLLARRGDELGLVLLSSFWGYVIINMLLHEWSNEAVAAQWWLLAGIGLASAKPGKHLAQTKLHKT